MRVDREADEQALSPSLAKTNELDRLALAESRAVDRLAKGSETPCFEEIRGGLIAGKGNFLGRVLSNEYRAEFLMEFYPDVRGIPERRYSRSRGFTNGWLCTDTVFREHDENNFEVNCCTECYFL